MRYSIIIILAILAAIASSSEGRLLSSNRGRASFPKARALVRRMSFKAKTSKVHLFGEQLGLWLRDLSETIENMENETVIKDLNSVIVPLQGRLDNVEKELQSINGTVVEITKKAKVMETEFRNMFRARKKGNISREELSRKRGEVQEIVNEVAHEANGMIKKFDSIYNELTSINSYELWNIVMKYKKEIWG